MSKKEKKANAASKFLFLAMLLTISLFIIPSTYGDLLVIVFLAACLFLLIGIITVIRSKRTAKVEAKPAQAERAVSSPSAPVVPSAPQAVSKPFKVSDEYLGLYLAYRYDDVEIDATEADPEKIKAIPTESELSIKESGEGQVALYSGDTLVGKLYDGRQRTMVRDFLRKPEHQVLASLRSTSPVEIGLYFYLSGDKLVSRMANRSDSKTYKLVSNKNQAMQDDISSCDVGDVVDFSYDYDKEKHLVSAGSYEIGFMPAGFNKYMEQHGDVTGRIYDIEEPEDDDEKYDVTVIVVPKA